MSAVFSIVIFPEHEPESLEATLRALETQDFPGHAVEVTILDAADNPERRKIASQFGANYRIPTSSTEPGALNEGVSAASGEFVAITDDDCEPVSHWLKAHESALRSGFALTGGPDKAPGSVSRFLRYLDYVLTSFAGSAGLRTTGGNGSAYYPRRWNMAFRKREIIASGGIDGTVTEAWELDLADRVRAAGMKLGFVPEAAIWHQRETGLSGYLRRNIRLALERARMQNRRLIYALPAAAALMGVALVFAARIAPVAGAVAAAGSIAYGLILAVSGTHAALTLRDPLALAAVPAMILMQHLTHALGYSLGRISSGGSYVCGLCRYLSRSPRV